MADIYNIETPFVMYVGNKRLNSDAKIASGVSEWAPNKIAAYLADEHLLFDGPHVEAVADAKKYGARTFVVGHAPFGGVLDPQTRAAILEAITCGFNVAAALHVRLEDDPQLAGLAYTHGVHLYDFRFHPEQYPLGTGQKRRGTRLLTVGTDCSCGKKYTALSLKREIDARGTEVNAKFCATGQTGFLISNSGINNDTIVADFLSGAAEWLSPDTDDKNTLYLIEGQGAIRHPAYTGGSMSLLAGSQPDMLVLCHTHGRTVMNNTTRPISIGDELSANLDALRIHGVTPAVVGLSINFCEVDLSAEERKEILEAYRCAFGLPTFDPSDRGSYEGIVDTIVESVRAYARSH